MPRLLLGALALLLAVPASAQFVPEATPVSDEAPPADGIQVHGRWTVTITNPDGSEAVTHEFQNALTTGGQRALVLLAGGDFLVQDWNLSLSFAGGGSELITEVDVDRDPDGFGDVTLSGFTSFTGEFQITMVRTQITVTPPTGPGGFTLTFTEKVLDSPITVAAGQGVTVNVEFSFE